jgi:predicted transcriptional regulator
VAVLERLNVVNNGTQENIRAEYVSLEEYYTKTIERRDNILSRNLTFLAALSTLAITFPTTPSITLIFPPIALFFALEWVSSYEINIVINKYIIYCLTNKMPGIGWNNYFSNWRQSEEQNSKIPFIRKFSRISIIFPISQVIAIYIGWWIQLKTNTNTDIFTVIFFVFDIICLVVTIIEIKKVIYKNPRDMILWQLGRKGGELTKTELIEYTGLNITELDTYLNQLKNKGEIDINKNNNQIIIYKKHRNGDCEKSTGDSRNSIAPQSSVKEIAGQWVEDGLERDYPELAQKIREGMKK